MTLTPGALTGIICPYFISHIISFFKFLYPEMKQYDNHATAIQNHIPKLNPEMAHFHSIPNPTKKYKRHFIMNIEIFLNILFFNSDYYLVDIRKPMFLFLKPTRSDIPEFFPLHDGQ